MRMYHANGTAEQISDRELTFIAKIRSGIQHIKFNASETAGPLISQIVERTLPAATWHNDGQVFEFVPAGGVHAPPTEGKRCSAMGARNCLPITPAINKRGEAWMEASILSAFIFALKNLGTRSARSSVTGKVKSAGIIFTIQSDKGGTPLPAASFFTAARISDERRFGENGAFYVRFTVPCPESFSAAHTADGQKTHGARSAP